MSYQICVIKDSICEQIQGPTRDVLQVYNLSYKHTNYLNGTCSDHGFTKLMQGAPINENGVSITNWI